MSRFIKIAASLFLTAVLFAGPLSVAAQGVPGFSGYPITPYTCTCSAALWSFFTPLWLSIVPMTGPLVYVPYATVPYAYFTPTMPAAPHVGAYAPGVQACWMYIGYGCAVLPSIGVMMWVGNGVPGAKGN